MSAKIGELITDEEDFAVIWAAPILPGKAEAWRRFVQELQGLRRQAFQEACRRLEVRGMRMWLAETARGTIGVVAVIAAQPESVMARLAELDAAFAAWFRAELVRLQGLDLARPPRLSPSELLLDWRGAPENPTAKEEVLADR